MSPLAFPTLYSTGQADLNTPRLWNVPLIDYARHLLCWHDQRFAPHARWRFFVFNMYMCQKARSTAQFYVSRTSHIKDLTREELTEALNTDANLLPRIVRCLTSWHSSVLEEPWRESLGPCAFPVPVRSTRVSDIELRRHAVARPPTAPPAVCGLSYG
jgi:hypothetical protein